MSYAVQVDHLCKSLGGHKILCDVSIRVKSGEIYGFLGANGAGKTSLMKTLYHILVPDSGKIMLLGETVSDKNHKVFARIGSLIESPVFYGEFDAKKNLAMHAAYMGVDDKRIEETLQSFGLTNVERKPVKQYSMGMKQRLALARAYLTQPELLILDEPMNGLDPQGITDIRENLRKINREHHTSILISSHILDEMAKIADTIGVIDNGSILEEISMKTLQENKMTLETYYLNLLKGGKGNEEITPAGA